MKKAILSLVLVMSCMTAAAGVAPVQRLSSNVQKPLEGRDLIYVEQSSQDLYWQFFEPPSTNLYLNTAKDLSGATGVTFVYSPKDRSWTRSITGSISSATNGLVYIGFPAGTNGLSPNSLNGDFDYVIQVTGTNVTLAYVIGSLTIEENVAVTGGSLYSIDNIIINWNNYGGYSNTASHGPYRAGAGIGFTTNSDGSCKINVVAYPFAKSPTNNPTAYYVLMTDGTSSNTYWSPVTNAPNLSISGGLLQLGGGGLVTLTTQSVVDAVSSDSVYLNSVTNLVGGTNINVVRSGRIITINNTAAGSDTNAIVQSATNAADTMALSKYALQSDTNAIRVGATNQAIQDILGRSYITASGTNGLASIIYVDGATNVVRTAATNQADTMALSKYALQSATNDHKVTGSGGFQGGTTASATSGGAIGTGAAESAGGGAVGENTIATTGGAVGYSAQSASGGAVGGSAFSGSGGAVGWNSTASDGGFAGGVNSTAGNGGAVGNNAVTDSGFAGGSNAWTTADGLSNGTPINAVQLGVGANTNPRSLKAYSHLLMDSNGIVRSGGNLALTNNTWWQTTAGGVVNGGGYPVTNATYIMTNNTAQSDLIYGGSNAIQWIRGTNTYILLLGLP